MTRVAEEDLGTRNHNDHHQVPGLVGRKADPERVTLRRLNRRLAREGQFISVSRAGDPARYLLRNLHNGNIEAWADTIDDWTREMETKP